jgi:sugar phosphate permease
MAFSGLIILMIVNGLTTTTLTSFDKVIVQEIFDGDRGKLRWRESIANGTSALLISLVGVFIDKIGVKRLLIFGSVLLTILLIAYSQITSPIHTYIIHCLLGIALITGGSIPVIILVSSWFKQKKGLALGITLAGTSAGGTFFPHLIVDWINHYGWRNSFLILAIFPAVLLLYKIIFIKNSPADIGLHPFGQSLSETSSDLRKQGMEYKEALQTRTFWLICICGMCSFFSVVGLVTNTFLHAQDLGFNEKNAANAISLYFSMAMIGKFGISALSDYINQLWVMRICFCIMTLGCVGYATMNPDLFFWSIGITALSWGGMYTLYNVIIVNTFGLKNAGKINGNISFFESLGSMLGPFLTGYLFTQTHTNQWGFSLIACLMAVATTLSLFFKKEAF